MEKAGDVAGALCLARVALHALCCAVHRQYDCCLQLGVSEDVDMKIRQVREQVKLETKLQNTLLRLQGSLEPILSVALAAGGPSEE